MTAVQCMTQREVDELLNRPPVAVVPEPDCPCLTCQHGTEVPGLAGFVGLDKYPYFYPARSARPSPVICKESGVWKVFPGLPFTLYTRNHGDKEDAFLSVRVGGYEHDFIWSSKTVFKGQQYEWAGGA